METKHKIGRMKTETNNEILKNSFNYTDYLTLTFSIDLRYPTNINAKQNCNGREKAIKSVCFSRISHCYCGDCKSVHFSRGCILITARLRFYEKEYIYILVKFLHIKNIVC